jgi:hypothetical protein
VIGWPDVTSQGQKISGFSDGSADRVVGIS